MNARNDQQIVHSWNMSKGHLAIVISTKSESMSTSNNGTSTSFSLLDQSCYRRPDPGHARAACRLLEGNCHLAHYFECTHDDSSAHFFLTSHLFFFFLLSYFTLFLLTIFNISSFQSVRIRLDGRVFRTEETSIDEFASKIATVRRNGAFVVGPNAISLVTFFLSFCLRKVR